MSSEISEDLVKMCVDGWTRDIRRIMDSGNDGYIFLWDQFKDRTSKSREKALEIVLDSFSADKSVDFSFVKKRGKSKKLVLETLIVRVEGSTSTSTKECLQESRTVKGVLIWVA